MRASNCVEPRFPREIFDIPASRRGHVLPSRNRVDYTAAAVDCVAALKIGLQQKEKAIVLLPAQIGHKNVTCDLPRTARNQIDSSCARQPRFANLISLTTKCIYTNVYIYISHDSLKIDDIHNLCKTNTAIKGEVRTRQNKLWKLGSLNVCPAKYAKQTVSLCFLSQLIEATLLYQSTGYQGKRS